MRIIILLTAFVLLTGARKLEREEQEKGVVNIRLSSESTVSSPRGKVVRSNVVRKEVEEEQESGEVDTEYYAAYADDATYSYSYSYGNSSYYSYGYGYGYGDDDGGDDDASNGDDGSAPVSNDDATNVVVIFERVQPRPLFSFTPLFNTMMGPPPLRSSRAQERDVEVDVEEVEAEPSSREVRTPPTATSSGGQKKKVDVGQFLRGRQSAPLPKNVDRNVDKNTDRQEPAQEGWLPQAVQSALQRFAPK